MIPTLVVGFIIFVLGILVGGWSRQRRFIRAETFSPTTSSTSLTPIHQTTGEWKELLGAVPEAIIICSSDLTVLDWNQAAEDLYGHTKASALGKPLYNLLQTPSSSAKRESVMKALTVEGKWEGRCRCTHQSGRELTISRAISRLRSANQSTAGYIVVDHDITEQAQIEEQYLRQATMLNAVRDAVIGLDPAMCITDWNDGAAQMYGYSADEALGKVLQDLLQFQQTDATRAEIDQALHQERFWIGRAACRHKDGRRLHISQTLSIIQSDEGDPTGYLCVDRDITGRIESEMRLARQATILASLSDSFVASNNAYLITEWNVGAEQLFGYTAAEALGHEIDEILRPQLAQAEIDQIRKCVLDQGLYLGQVTYLHKTGRRLMVQMTVSLLKDRDGQTIGSVGLGRDVTAWREAERALRDSEERFRALTENSQDIITVIGSGGKTIYISPSVERVLGYSPGEPIDSDSMRYVHPEDISTFYGLLAQERTHAARVGPIEIRMRHKDGSWRDLEVFGKDASDIPGIRGIITNAHDITAQKQARLKLEQQNAYLEALHSTTLALIERRDTPVLLETIMLRAGELLGTQSAYLNLIDPDRQVLIPRYGTGFYRDYRNYQVKKGDGLSGLVWETGTTVNISSYAAWPYRLPDPEFNRHQALIGTPLRSGGQIIGVIGLARFERDKPFTDDEVRLFEQFAELASVVLDNARLFEAAQTELAERTRAEAQLWRLNAELEERVQQRTIELQQRQAELRAVLDSMGEGVVYSENARIRYANPAFSELTGYPVDDLLDRSLNIFATEHADEAALYLLNSPSIFPGSRWRGIMPWRRADGTPFQAALTLARIQARQVPSNSIAIVVRDITEEKRLEEQKGTFIANASHELRTPLTNLKTRLYLVHRQPERINDHLSVIERVTERMIRLVEDLLDISRFERGVIQLDRKLVELRRLVWDVLDTQRMEAESKAIALSAELPDAPCFVFADSDRLTQVMVNLITNAINYTAAGGQVKIDVSTDERNAVIRVSDTGIGIEPDHLSHIFEPFFRVSEGAARGTGLGLSISREIIALHGGSLSVESHPGQGSTFIVQFPLNMPQAHPAQNAQR